MAAYTRKEWALYLLGLVLFASLSLITSLVGSVGRAILLWLPAGVLGFGLMVHANNRRIARETSARSVRGEDK